MVPLRWYGNANIWAAENSFDSETREALQQYSQYYMMRSMVVFGLGSIFGTILTYMMLNT